MNGHARATFNFLFAVVVLLSVVGVLTYCAEPQPVGEATPTPWTQTPTTTAKTSTPLATQLAKSMTPSPPFATPTALVPVAVVTATVASTPTAVLPTPTLLPTATPVVSTTTPIPTATAVVTMPITGAPLGTIQHDRHTTFKLLLVVGCALLVVGGVLRMRERRRG